MARRTAGLFIAAAVLVISASPGVRLSHAGIETTVHNLSASGPGPTKATETGDICIFCHVPHHAVQTRALWNKSLPPTVFTLYESNTLAAGINQPTGSSRLCLSCHDGTTALGDLRVPPQGVTLSLGPLTGSAALGTNLSDDHPVSFVYDSALMARNPRLVDPAALPINVRLDRTAQMQCTTCHNPHQNTYGNFLVMDNRYAALCTTCHLQTNWSGSSHAVSTAKWNGVGTNPMPPTGYATVVENGCANCHASHSAGHPQRLLRSDPIMNLCLSCHNGAVAPQDISADLQKPSRHPVSTTSTLHDPKEDPLTMTRHAACEDCHNPHQAVNSTAVPLQVSGPLFGVSGVDASGAHIDTSLFTYQVCFKCHGLVEQPSPFVVRQDPTTNTRTKFNPANASYHPVETIGKNATLAGLEPGYTASSIISCTDCHSSDSSVSGGSGGKGPHGSIYAPILQREYQVADPVMESFQAYNLCYKCHTESAVLNDIGGFPHRTHVVTQRTSCATCHDAHGSQQNRALINFMVRDRTGNPIVTVSGSGQMLFQSSGPGHGTCYLTCHGSNHDPRSY